MQRAATLRAVTFADSGRTVSSGPNDFLTRTRPLNKNYLGSHVVALVRPYAYHATSLVWVSTKSPEGKGVSTMAISYGTRVQSPTKKRCVLPSISVPLRVVGLNVLPIQGLLQL